MIEAFLDYLSKAAALPRPVWAAAGSTLFAFAVTQRAKQAIPLTWSPHLREVSAQSIAFLAGFISTYLLWRSHDLDALAAALIVGLWSPALWNILMLVIGWWKPELREALSNPAGITKRPPTS